VRLQGQGAGAFGTCVVKRTKRRKKSRAETKREETSLQNEGKRKIQGDDGSETQKGRNDERVSIKGKKPPFRRGFQREEAGKESNPPS